MNTTGGESWGLLAGVDMLGTKESGGQLYSLSRGLD